MDWLAVASGFAIGAIVGLTGVGGGSLMTPLLMGVFNLSAPVAIGTDLWFAAITKANGTVAHHRQGQVDYGIVGWMLLGSIPATIATLVLMRHTGMTKGVSLLMMQVLGVALLMTAAAVACRPFCHTVGLKLDALLTASRKRALTVLAGLLLGVLVSLSSIGAGAIGATLTLVLYPRLPIQRLIGTDIAHAAVLTLVAGLGHAALGNVNWPLLASLLVGSLPGIWLGARLIRSLPEKVTRGLLCVSLLTAGLRVIH
ncbi:sulfite exporter TauE/SafE family protein [Rhizobacter sp. SG703]|uniref:sulfite exporter TauE/SafE family protein n=1 Tax=Rhizobacter sp. SG703 TaxID=2587140 RepID=UPI0014454FC6|nr:sulfite exporter TauE/SafE family protein [Rhizobacter sp. SG703]NKI94225.1 hypothetical protein [Rhizobacter sp. SG703]